MPRGVYKRARDRYCPECGRGPFSAQGLRGHLNFYHGRARRTPEVERIGRAVERFREFKRRIQKEK